MSGSETLVCSKALVISSKALRIGITPSSLTEDISITRDFNFPGSFSTEALRAFGFDEAITTFILVRAVAATLTIVCVFPVPTAYITKNQRLRLERDRWMFNY